MSPALFIADNFKPCQLHFFLRTYACFLPGNGHLLFRGIDPFQIGQQQSASRAGPHDHPVFHRIQLLDACYRFGGLQHIN
jgi:hypothetical protein